MQRTGRATALRIVWHDTADGLLAAAGLSLAHSRGLWRLERLYPGPHTPWPPLTPAPLVEEASSLGALTYAVPPALVPVGAMVGRLRTMTLPGPSPVMLTVLEGGLQGIAAQVPACRVQLAGPADAVGEGALLLARTLRVSVPRSGLATAALTVAQRWEGRERAPDPPQVVAGQALTDSAAHILGRLLDGVLHWSASAGSGETPVPVHQMRVGTRRLRSAFSILGPALACPAMEALGPAVRDLAARLGGARDWDVFIDGTGRRIADAFPDDRRVRTLLAMTRRRRLEAYSGLRQFLDGPEFRALTVALGCLAALRPWETPENAAAMQSDTAIFAAATLSRRLKRARRDGRGIATLSVPALHELRKDCKRLRYAAEFFRPLFAEKPARRFLQRLAAVQEELGLLNDGAAAAALMGQLGRAERGYAAGLVGGFVAAGNRQNRKRIEAAWRGFRAQPPFWPRPTPVPVARPCTGE